MLDSIHNLSIICNMRYSRPVCRAKIEDAILLFQLRSFTQMIEGSKFASLWIPYPEPLDHPFPVHSPRSRGHQMSFNPDHALLPASLIVLAAISMNSRSSSFR